MRFLRLGDQLVAFAELRGAGRADLRTRGRLSLGDAVRTHRCTSAPWGKLAPLVFRDAERARHHAVAAAHALRRIVGDRAERSLLQRAYRTNRSAGRILAIHAQAAHEFVAARQHDRSVCAQTDIFRPRWCRRREACFASAQACSHCLQPMQTVESYKSALLMKYFSRAGCRVGRARPESFRPTPELNEEKERLPT